MYGMTAIATAPSHGWVARERPARYHASAAAAAASEAPAAASPLAAALARLEQALEALAVVDLDAEDDTTLADGAVVAQRLANRQAFCQLRLVERFDAREAFRSDGAVTAASWLRARTRTGHAACARLVEAARRLRRLPRLAHALAEGAVSYRHVLEVTRAAIPQRRAAIEACEDTLTALARAATPRGVARAVRKIRDHADPDGADAEPLPEAGPDVRRELHLHRGIDGLWNVRGTLDVVTGELLATVVDAYDTPDAPEVPPGERRSAAQRRVDALSAGLRGLLDAGTAPSVQGARPHMLVFCDLHTLLGKDEAATLTPRLRHSGEIDPALARHVAATGNTTATMVLAMGPWRITNVGRAHRTLPAWLRRPLELVHRTCRGPDCDRPATWTEAHHVREWRDGGHTSLDDSVPLCTAHHRLVSVGGWTVILDPDTGVCTWTSPSGRVIHTHPP